MWSVVPIQKWGMEQHVHPCEPERTGSLSLGTLSLWSPLAPFYLGDSPSCPPLWSCTSHQSSQPDALSIEGEQLGMWFFGRSPWHVLVHPGSVVLCAGNCAQQRVRVVWGDRQTSVRDRFTSGLWHLFSFDIRSICGSREIERLYEGKVVSGNTARIRIEAEGLSRAADVVGWE